MVGISNCLAYYSMDDDDTVSGELIDQSPNGYDATIYGTTSGQTGHINEAHTFDDTNDYVTIPGAVGAYMDTFSVAFWIKTSNTSEIRALDDVGGSGGTNFSLQLNRTSSNRIRLFLRDIDNNVLDASTTSADTWNDDDWHLIVASWNGNTNTVAFYIDNESQGVTYATQNTPDNFDAWTHMAFGGGQVPQPTDGEIDEFCIFSSVLSSDDRDLLWNSGDGLQYPWELSEGTNLQLNISDTWKTVDAMQINIGDVWKEVAGLQVNIGDVWKTID